MTLRLLQLTMLGCCLWLLPAPALQAADVSIGSKTFTESYVLGEIAAQLLEGDGFTVERQLGLGGTLVAYEALKAGSIDLIKKRRQDWLCEQFHHCSEGMIPSR